MWMLDVGDLPPKCCPHVEMLISEIGPKCCPHVEKLKKIAGRAPRARDAPKRCYRDMRTTMMFEWSPGPLPRHYRGVPVSVHFQVSVHGHPEPRVGVITGENGVISSPSGSPLAGGFGGGSSGYVRDQSRC